MRMFSLTFTSSLSHLYSLYLFTPSSNGGNSLGVFPFGWNPWLSSHNLQFLQSIKEQKLSQDIISQLLVAIDSFISSTGFTGIIRRNSCAGQVFSQGYCKYYSTLTSSGCILRSKINLYFSLKINVSTELPMSFKESQN